ncbi:MAG: beta-eliminating lyase-related protein, partial [Dehalococcoidales bacterium]|nr:beta-eliminating lyase-related protein [Dehalococcoidales bacterium]
LCGSKEFIERTRKWRKMSGGGMRQAGVLAAAGIVALETMVDRLAEDHANARRLADGLVRIPCITLAQEKVPTNILMFDLSPALSGSLFVAKLAERGVKVSDRGGNRFRAVTNRMVGATDIEEALKVIDKVCRELLKQS